MSLCRFFFVRLLRHLRLFVLFLPSPCALLYLFLFCFTWSFLLWRFFFFCPFFMRAACVWSILLDLSVVFFFFCFLHLCPIKINYQLSTIVCYGDISSATICFFGLCLCVLCTRRVVLIDSKSCLEACLQAGFSGILYKEQRLLKHSKGFVGFCCIFKLFLLSLQSIWHLSMEQGRVFGGDCTPW